MTYNFNSYNSKDYQKLERAFINLIKATFTVFGVHLNTKTPESYVMKYDNRNFASVSLSEDGELDTIWITKGVNTIDYKKKELIAYNMAFAMMQIFALSNMMVVDYKNKITDYRQWNKL